MHSLTCLLLSVSVPPAADEVDSAILGRLKGYLALFGGCTHGCGSVLVLASVLQQKACFPWVFFS